MRAFERDTRFEAWADATEHLIEAEAALNVILAIKTPESDGPASLRLNERMDSYLKAHDEYSVHTVAETIFPGWEYKRRGLSGVFETYANEEFPTLSKGSPKSWGTYAHRLVRRRTAEGKEVNPLELMIEKMKTELASGNRKQACYEIGVAEGEYDLPLYNTVDDDWRHMGGPCLSHVSFKLFEGEVHLTALYRSHDYLFKAFGNMLGLARLQACVAHEVGQPVGSLVVHSTYAYRDSKGAKGDARTLLRELRQIKKEGEG